jgi:hypothetical protein
MMGTQKCHPSLPVKPVEEKCTLSIIRARMGMNTGLKPEWGKEKWKIAPSRIEEGMGMGWKVYGAPLKSCSYRIVK